MNIAAENDLCTDDGVDVRGSVKGHRHGREALKGMLSYNIVSRPRVFVFRIIPSTRSDGNPAERHRLVLPTATFVSLIAETQRKGFRCEHSLFTR